MGVQLRRYRLTINLIQSQNYSGLIVGFVFLIFHRVTRISTTKKKRVLYRYLFRKTNTNLEKSFEYSTAVRKCRVLLCVRHTKNRSIFTLRKHIIIKTNAYLVSLRIFFFFLKKAIIFKFGNSLSCNLLPLRLFTYLT